MSAADLRFMERALLLGERGRGRTTPNPSVGAVVVSAAGVIVGQGTTSPAGGPHAEILALDRAGAEAAGATLYCTLEPCAHTGRTGPCVERIVVSGVRRVVAAMRDPNPRVAGRGVAYLRAHGVDVLEGVGAREAARQHAPFTTWVTRHRPFVIAKAAVSADGFVGRRDRRVPLTGPEANRFFQRQRAEVDAIGVGSATMRIDDPWLTARDVYRARPLTRVIVDWHGQVSHDARVFSTMDAGPVIMVVLAREVAQRADAFAALAARGVLVDQYAERDVTTLLARLAQREVVTLLLEGGPRLQRVFWDAGAIDRIQLVRTPVVLGQGVPNELPTVPGESHQRMLGRDLLVETDVHGTD